ncbi:MAG: hypothetical protein A2589_00185 [Candidatus Vogelbacteria bacterium RIFOXYD1_FULL_46_19]|uniref:Pseudouridine synthase n=1 Tax=Candidatus Vogelbacteria bacterium RIFOXYD1_FULL_46_19 TaxID=1802439 RepID=A0A1G2QJD2_9BACT|nr:MAG: hypothetical protein A2589_00185 [Candidatus Vogelbacteria bacterium RIFOXYD1_FULL_46_19]
MNLEPTIIFEDDNTVAIDKPAGLAVHSDGRRPELTLADWVIGRFPDTLEVGEPAKMPDGREIPRPGIVHRLDRDTSGVMVIAKNEPSFQYLKQQFKNRLVKKTYLAIVHGVFANPEEEKVIDLPIGRSKRDPRLRVASPKAASHLRSARTIFKVLETFSGYSLVEAKPETGRTHQLRAHFKALQHPIVGDHLYAQNKPTEALGLKRQALHAAKLQIALLGGQKVTLEADLPQDMTVALDNLRGSC